MWFPRSDSFSGVPSVPGSVLARPSYSEDMPAAVLQNPAMAPAAPAMIRLMPGTRPGMNPGKRPPHIVKHLTIYYEASDALCTPRFILVFLILCTYACCAISPSPMLSRTGSIFPRYHGSLIRISGTVSEGLSVGINPIAYSGYVLYKPVLPIFASAILIPIWFPYFSG